MTLGQALSPAPFCHRSIRNLQNSALRLLRNLIALSSIMLAACSSSGAKREYTPPWVLSPNDTVHVTIKRGAPSSGLRKPIGGAGSGAAYGAGQTSGAILSAGMSDCTDGWCFLAIPVAVVAAPLGALYGASASRSKEEVDATIAAIRSSVARSRPWEDIERSLLAGGRVEPNGPNVRRGYQGRNRLVLQIEQFELLQTGSRLNPGISVAIRVVGRFEQSGLDSPVTLLWSHVSRPDSFFEIGENDATLLDRAIRNAGVEIGKAIRNEFASSVR